MKNVACRCHYAPKTAFRLEMERHHIGRMTVHHNLNVAIDSIEKLSSIYCTIFCLVTNWIDEQFQMDRERITNIMEDESIGSLAKCYKVGLIGATRMINMFGGNKIMVGIFISPLVGFFILMYFATEIDEAFLHHQLAVLEKLKFILSFFLYIFLFWHINWT